MESLLIEEYSKSIAIKEQADQLTIGVRPALKKEPAQMEESTVFGFPAATGCPTAYHRSS